MRILITLHPDRDRCGTLTLLDAAGICQFGPVPVAARAGNAEAAGHGNPGRLALHPHGDPPTGAYRLQRLLLPRANGWYPRQAFGPHGALLLRPADGLAALAEANGRFDFFIQGGPAGRQGRLRAASSGFRLRNRDLRGLLARLDGGTELLCICVEDATAAFIGLVDTDPPVLPSAMPSLAAAAAIMPRRRMLASLGAASGAMMVNLSGVFVGLAAPAIAQEQEAYPSGGDAYPQGAQSSSGVQAQYPNQSIEGIEAPPPPRLEEPTEIPSPTTSPPRYDDQPGMVSETPPPPRYDDQPGMVSETPPPPRYDDQPGMVSETPPDYSQAPPGSFLNSTQNGGPPDYSQFPPGSFLDQTAAGQAAAGQPADPNNGGTPPPDYSQAPPGSFLNSTQNGGPPDYSQAPPGSFLSKN